MATFEGYERRIDKINACLKEYGFTDLDQVKEGNLVYLYVLNKTLTYEVDKITVTTPDDTDAIHMEI